MRTEKLRISRFIIFFIFIVVAFIVLAGRFFQLQVINGKEFARQFENQCGFSEVVHAQRGTIYDRNGQELAFTIETEQIFVKTDTLRQIELIVEKVAPILKLSRRDLYKKLAANLGNKTCLADKVDPIKVSKIKALELDCLKFETKFDRIYPYNKSISALLGFLNHKFKAQAGVELYCDEFLTGRDGYQVCRKAASGELYPLYSDSKTPPIDGNDVYLTIDIEYQQILEEEIVKAVEEWKAISGTGVLMEIKTGNILAIYHYDTAHTDPDYRYPKMCAITDLYEPGSTFKTIAYGALLEEGLIDLADTIYAGEGAFRFNGKTLRDDKELGIITQAEAFIVSSNIATGRLALRLGPKNLYRYTRDFGFGLSTGLNFPGEVPGRLAKPEVWSDYYCAMLSIGHEVSTSVLHMARVFGCIGGDGSLMKPLLIDRIVSPTGGTIEKSHPEKVHQVFSGKTITAMQDLCALVVDTGTAKYALTEGITFSGKTGTAEKLDTKTGLYDKSRYIGSFGGYFPREDPQICGIIIIDEPDKINYGGYVAAPAFAMAGKRITDLEKRRQAALQDGMYALNAVIKQDEYFDNENNNHDSIVNIASAENNAEPVSVSNVNIDADSSLVYLPDLHGKSARTAVKILLDMGLDITLEGHGNVIASVPCSGSSAHPGEKIKLICAQNGKEAGN